MQKQEQLLSRVKRIHMIGVGGAGMCPLAEILQPKGYILTGSDNNETDTLARVRALGVKVTLGHFAENVQGAQLVVYSAAIMKDNPELLAAAEQGIPVMERSALLGWVTRQYGNTLAVCGTHGKTTVTSMLTHVLLKAGRDPAAVIGGKLPLIGSNGRAGNSDTLVVEACEYVDTFLALDPQKTVLLNIDEDHMEYFKTLDNLIASFHRFSALTTGLLVVNGDDGNAKKAVQGLPNPVVTFGASPGNDYYPEQIVFPGGVASTFWLMHRGERLCEMTLCVPGKHNVLNATAAAALLLDEGLTPDEIAAGLQSFTGAGRRFELLGYHNGAAVVDDYAHHPLELEVTLRAAMNMGFKRVFAVFQPFTFSRTARLLDDFARVLCIPDIAVVTPIMGSREVNTLGIDSRDLTARIPGSVYSEDFEQTAAYIKANAGEGDLVITLGCGDVFKVAKLILATPVGN